MVRAMEYQSIYGTRLFSPGAAASCHYLVIPTSYTGDIPASLDAEDAVSDIYCAAFVYLDEPAQIQAAADAEKLLTVIDGRTAGRRCFLWNEKCLEFSGKCGNFYTRSDFSINLAETITFSFPAQTSFTWDTGSHKFCFNHNSSFRLSNYQYGDNPFSDVTVPLADGNMSFLLTIQDSHYFANVFQAGFDYGYGTDCVLSFPPIQKYIDSSFDLRATLNFTAVRSSELLFTKNVSFETTFFSLYGETVIFTAGEHAGFGFSPRPFNGTPSKLVLTGEYYPSTSYGTHQKGILCGMSGTEYFILPDGQPLYFLPDKNHGAYAPQFPAAAPSIDDFVHPASSLPLTDTYASSWMKLPAGTIYYSQPSDNPYYSGSGQLLDPAALYTILPSDTPYFPIVPSCKPEYTAYINTVIGPARAAILAQCPENSLHYACGESNAIHTIAAPSGYLMQMNGNTPEAILLSPEIRLEHPSPALANAFNTSGMLLVMADYAAAPYTFHIGISGWNLEFKPGGTYLVIKSMRGKLFDDTDKANSLIGNVSVWTARNDFSSKNPAQAARDLMLLLEDAMADEANREYYLPLREAVTTEDWRGYIFFETPLGAESFPEELRSVFPAGQTVSMRYFCARQTKLAPGENGPQFAENASYSGYAAYQATGFTGSPLPPEKADAYAFRTMELHAFFDKGTLAHFGSISQLDLPAFCGLKTKSGTVILPGSYTTRDGMPSFSLQAEDGQSLRFTKDAVLTSAALGNVSLETRAGNDIFTINGSLCFSAYPDGDILSYDMLLLSGYQLVRENGMFREDLSGITIDAANSTARGRSLARALNLVPEKFITDAKHFTALGYTCPCKGRLQDIVCGLQYTAVLGTAGNLTPGQSISMNLLAGWDEQGQLALGIHLPNVLPLEGILSLTTGKAKLEYCKDSGFSLYLSDISLKALGALKLPPNGQISVTIHEGGWFAAYIKQT